MSFDIILNCIVNSISALLFFPLWIILMIFLNTAIPLVNSKKFTLNLTLCSSIINIFFAIIAVVYCIKNPLAPIESNICWINSDIKIHLGTLVDSLSSTLLLFVSIILLFIQAFSYRQLKENENLHRFYVYLNLLTFSVLGLILSSNLIQSFIFIVLLSTVAYLLCTFSCTKKSEELKPEKLYLINAFGDICLFGGVLNLIYFNSIFNSSEKLILLSYSNFTFNVDMLYSMIFASDYSLISLLILICIIIKFGQIPFSGYLINLANFCSVVNVPIIVLILGLSGVYLAIRLYPMFILSDFITKFMIVIGSLSTICGICFALSQNKFKNLLNCTIISMFGILLCLIGIKFYSCILWFFVICCILFILLNFFGEINFGNVNTKKLKILNDRLSFSCVFADETCSWLNKHILKKGLNIFEFIEKRVIYGISDILIILNNFIARIVAQIQSYGKDSNLNYAIIILIFLIIIAFLYYVICGLMGV